MKRRRFLEATGAAVVGGLAGCLDTTPPSIDESEITAADGQIAQTAIPESPGDYDYAVMGRPSQANATITYYGSWKCPICAQFLTGSADGAFTLPEIYDEYVKGGQLAVEFRGLAYINGSAFLGPDAPRATEFSLGVWRSDPERYWPYHETVFANQPPESQRWGSLENLQTFASVAEVESPEDIAQDAEEGVYEDAIRATSNRADKLGISGTPTLVADGQTFSPFDPQEASSILNAAAEK